MRHRAWLALAVTGFLLAACGQIAEAPDTAEPTLGQLATLLYPSDSFEEGEDNAGYWHGELGLGATLFWWTYKPLPEPGTEPAGPNFIVPDVPEGGWAWRVAVVKSDGRYYLFDDPQLTVGSELDTNTDGLWQIAFLFKERAEATGGEWCSPGFWRNNPVAAADAAAAAPEGGFSLDGLYSVLIGPIEIKNERQGDRLGASPDPTLWEVLQMPQVYGGDAFNAVGDLLSALHLGVDFVYGERVEDSCPLSADASRGGTT